MVEPSQASEMLKVLLEMGPRLGLRSLFLMPKLRRQGVAASAEAEPALAADARKDARG